MDPLWVPIITSILGATVVFLWVKTRNNNTKPDSDNDLDPDYFFNSSFVSRSDPSLVVNVVELYRTKVKLQREDCDSRNEICEFDMSLVDFRYHFKPLD